MIWVPVLVGDSFVWPRRWQVSRGDTGATQDMTLGGNDCRWYDGGVTGQTSLVGDVLVHFYGTSSKDPVGQVPRCWMREELHGVGKVCDLCRVYNLSIAASSDMGTVRSRTHYGSTV